MKSLPHPLETTTCTAMTLTMKPFVSILALGLAALRLAVNLACFTKTRVCSSCFGSTNSGTRLFTKTQICLSCFGSTNLGHSASFKSSDGLFYLDVWLWFSFPPLILSFHRPCAPRQPRWSLSHYFGRDPSHSMHLANEFGLTALASVSSSRPPQLGICLLPLICLNDFDVCLHDVACPCDFAVTFV